MTFRRISSTSSPGAVAPVEAIAGHLEEIFALERRGDAREESYYPTLARLLESCAALLGHDDLEILVLPRGTEAGTPDLQVWRRGRGLVGYAEAKRPHADLERAAGSEQVQRYLRTFPNLLLTDFYEFHLFRSERRIATARAGNGFTGRHLGCRPAAEEPAGLLRLLATFFDFATPPPASAAGLARDLAGRTRMLRAGIETLLAADPEGRTELSALFTRFRKHLLGDLDPREFSDLYAQTLAYGLLTARWHTPGELDRRSILDHIPRANGVLREVFRWVSDEPPPEVAWIVDDLIDLLAAAPVHEILSTRDAPGHDPILHFYETFLAEYDRELRERRGVYYTPAPVVSFVVRSVHRLLQDRLGRPSGLADPSVTLLDPAAGTLTFVVEAIRLAVETCRHEGAGEGAVRALLRDHLLRNFYAFELMMAPYIVGHLKIGLVLAELGYEPNGRERFPLYLTNALRRDEPEQRDLYEKLAREAARAERVKLDQPITVLLGNPPWSGHSANRDPRIDVDHPYTAADGRRDEGWLQVDGRPLGERNTKWLRDDYARFLRFAQWKIDRVEEGIVAFVTNHGWLDGPTFRGMRHSLLQSFDQVLVLDLHGNRKRQEAAPDGGPDENVFSGIEQGVAIVFLVKGPGLPKRVARADLWGSRRDKLDWLKARDVTTVEWTDVEPAGPAVLFHPRDARLETDWLRGVRLPAIFPEHSVGIVTARDRFVVGFDRDELAREVDRLRARPLPEPEVAAALGLRDTNSWRLAAAWERLGADPAWAERCRRFLYRPFDERWLFDADYFVERPRERVMRHLRHGGNRALLAPRQCKEEPDAFVTDTLAGHKTVSAFDVTTVFPLWLHPDGPLAGPAAANLSPRLVAALARAWGEPPAADLLFDYVYAVLQSGLYRRRWADQLRREYARIPFPRDRGLLLELAGLGRRLVHAHLLHPSQAGGSRVRFEPAGSGRLGRARRVLRDYRSGERRVYVNEEGQGFEGIAPEVWEFRLGGFQILDRWLQDRAGRTLTYREIETFQRIARAIEITLAVRPRIDQLFAEVDRRPLEGVR
jgi:hypothetical protein